MTFTVIPAIDVRKSRVVRLAQGDYGRQIDYDASPHTLARRYADAGAQWLHLVDLEAARSGGYGLQSLLAELRDSTPLHIQTGGGVRSEADVDALLTHGAARVVVGTQAVRHPSQVREWLRTFGAEKITLAFDVRQDDNGIWRLPIAGWTENSRESLDDLLERYADVGLRHVLCTDISRDGMLSGFNLVLYHRLAQRWPDLSIQASGGVRSLDDVRAVRAAGAGAAILGRALLEGYFEPAEAIAC
jgi:phosphoribosylformimino-5-aminoimidazole carboxamide ribotide isomerase